MTVDELLAAHRITLTSTAPDRYYTTCPQCSHTRSIGHQDSKCLGVTIKADGTVYWGCNHCNWTGPEKGQGNGHQRQGFAATYDYNNADGSLSFQKVRNPPGQQPRFWCRRPDGRGGWINNTSGIDHKPLYRWPEIRAAMQQGAPIAIVEGEKDADRLWSLGIAATCNFDGAADTIKSPNAKPKWKPDYSEQLRGADLVVFNDNDPQGYAHADVVCKMSLGVAKRVRRLDLAPHWPGMPKGGDVTDWLDRGHTREELKRLIEQAPEYGQEQPSEQPQPKSRFQLKPFDTIAMSTARNYLVKGVLPRVGLGVVWGAPKTGKSFWTFDLTMHIATGCPYRGRKVQQGPVVYLALEGGAGFANRIEAWRQRYLAEDHDEATAFFLVDVPVDLVADRNDLIAAIRHQLAQPPAIVVVDTLNRSIAGDENKSDDMAKFIKAADTLRTAFNCLVLIVHHCGVSGSRPRGHTSLAGADDVQIEVTRNKDGVITTRVEHMKDAEAGASFASKLESVELGKDEDDDPITSCIIIPTDAAGAKGPKLSKNNSLAFTILTKLIKTEGIEPPADGKCPPGIRVCHAETWRKRFYDAYPTDKQEAKQKAYARAHIHLIDIGLVGFWSVYVWLRSDEPDNPDKMRF
jgi:hypothetical protein